MSSTLALYEINLQSVLVLKHVDDAVQQAIGLFAGDKEWAGREGGAFCLANAGLGIPYRVALVGHPNPEKVSKYVDFCQEKSRRLAFNLNHVSSWESRNPDADQYGGAIRCQILILSFSGFPELGDEAIMLKAAQTLGGLPGDPLRMGTDVGALDRIAVRSKNPYWPKMR
jgi:hypothetical protein